MWKSLTSGLLQRTYMPHTALIFRTWFEDMENKWKAWWIGDGGDKPLYLRRSFTLDQKPSRAIAFVSGLGHHNFSINGQPASEHVLDPGWTNYHRTVVGILRVPFILSDCLRSICETQSLSIRHIQVLNTHKFCPKEVLLIPRSSAAIRCP